MKWNTPDWNLGLLVGMLFGLYIGLHLIDESFQASSDVKRWIGLSAFIASLLLVNLRRWRFPSQNAPESTP